MWSLAWSDDATESPVRTMMKIETSMSVAVSFGRRRWNRIRPSSALRAPTTITRPSTNSAFASSEPTSDVCATTISPAESAKMTMKNSGRLPSVDWRKPVTPGPKREPTASVANETTQARPASATAALTNGTTPAVMAYRVTPAATVATAVAASAA